MPRQESPPRPKKRLSQKPGSEKLPSETIPPEGFDLGNRPSRHLPPRECRPKSAFQRFLRLIPWIIGGGAGSVLFGLAVLILLGQNPTGHSRVVNVPPGASTFEISQTLHQEGVVVHWLPFWAEAQIAGFFRHSIKAGEYAFSGTMTTRDVLLLLLSGRTVLHKISIPEGWTTWQIVERLNATEPLSPPLLSAASLQEGRFLPDTYLFHRGQTKQQILTDMRLSQEKMLKTLWKNRSPSFPLASLKEAVILASLVEKETGISQERPLVAGVFLNRLRLKMRLQSDPTVIYGLTKGEGRLERPLSKADLEQATPYNTYRISALPPTPICNPGREALTAVFFPAKTEALYFVANGEGGHVFSKTLEEHTRRVQDWREKKKKAAPPSPDL